MGHLVVISAPSGAGKTTVIKELVRILPGSTRLISTTTRAPREGENNAVDYFFIPREQFITKIQNGEFLEYNYYNGNYYGTEKYELDRALKMSRYVLSPMDVNGKERLDLYGFFHTSFFLLPTTRELLRERLIKRGGMPAEEMEERLKIADHEMEKAKSYDWTVVLGDATPDFTALFIEEKLYETRLLSPKRFIKWLNYKIKRLAGLI
jgi:guanylate kinase